MARYLLANSSTFDYTFDYTFQDLSPRIAGSRGGAVFQKIGSQFVIRHRSVPCNKRTPRQTRQRNRFESIQTRWYELTPEQRATFLDQVANYPRTDSLGNSYNISPINLQQSMNTNNIIAGIPLIEEAQAPVAFPGFTAGSMAIVPSVPIAIFPIDPAVVPTNFALIIYTTAPLSPGQLTPGTPFLHLATLTEGINTNLVNLVDNYINDHGSIQGKEGMQVFVQQHLLSLISSQPSMSITTSVIITP